MKRRNTHLVLFLVLAFTISGLGANLLVVLLEGGKVLTGLGELTFLHTLTDIPVHEGTLGIHEVELVVNTGQSLGHSGRVGNHGASAHDLGEITTGHHSGWLVVDAALETSGTPVHELDGALGLDGGNSSVHVLGDDITTVHQAHSHVFAVAGIALGEHRSGLEHRVGDLAHGQLLVVRLLSRDDRRVRRKHEVDTRVRHQVGLELGDIDVQGAVETERGRERRDDLRDEAVEVGVRGALDVEAAAADVVDCLVVKHDGDVGVLEERVGREDRVVRLNDRGGDLGRRVDGEAELGLAAVVDREALEEEGAEAGAGATADGVEDQEALEAGAVVRELADAVEDEVDDLLANGVVAAGVVVGGVLLAGDQLLRVVELAVRARAHLVDDGRLEVDEHTARDVLARAGLREEGVEGVVAAANRLVRGHLAVGLDAVLEAVELPAGVTGLDTGLAKVDRDNLTHICSSGFFV